MDINNDQNINNNENSEYTQLMINNTDSNSNNEDINNDQNINYNENSEYTQLETVTNLPDL